MNDHAALTEIVRARLSWASLHWFPARSRGGIKAPVIAPEIAPEIANAIISSDWLVAHDAEIHALYSDWRYCPRCGRAPDWEGPSSPGAPCMGCGRYPAGSTHLGESA